ncbi:MAG: CPBP family intramembrane metalloprotease [Kiritimatiellae bacterium]|nr:CPBP family intramembrane metalloprotease [Kiritimatiellia bacterium]
MFDAVSPDTKQAVMAYTLFGFLLIVAIITDVFLLCTGRVRTLSNPKLINKLKTRQWSLPDSGLLIITSLWCYTVIIAACSTILRLESSSHLLKILSIFLTTSALPLVQILIIVYLSRRAEFPLADSFGIRPGLLWLSIKQGLVIYLAALPVVIFYSMLYIATIEYLGYPTKESQEIIKTILDPSLSLGGQIYLVIVAVALAPLVEEMVFRGVLIPALLKKVRLSLAISVVSLLFAAIHFHVPSLVPLFLIATAFSLGYLYSGSIIVPIVMHATFNLINLAAIFILKS